MRFFINRRLPVLRYGGLSVGGQLPVLDVDPVNIQNVLHQLGNMMNITGVGTLLRHSTKAPYSDTLLRHPRETPY